MTQTSVHPVAMLPFGMLNAFLVTHQGRAMLVDTGLPGARPRIERALRAQGMAWSDLALTVLTHAHIDHAGSAARVQASSPAPLILHRDEQGYARGERPVLRPSGPFGWLFQKTGAIERPFEPVTADRVMTGDTLDLGEYGFPARLVHTPGHTPGSVSVVLDGKRVIAGDLLASGILLGGIALRGRPKSPPFEEDMNAVAASLQRLLAMGCETFYLGHGGPLPATAVRRHIDRLRRAAATGARVFGT